MLNASDLFEDIFSAISIIHFPDDLLL